MALHTELPIYRTGVRLLDLAVKAQVQMPRTVKRVLGEKITQHCVEMLDLMALANATQRDVRAGHIDHLLTHQPNQKNACKTARRWWLRTSSFGGPSKTRWPNCNAATLPMLKARCLSRQ